jgi:hypothetical protein
MTPHEEWARSDLRWWKEEAALLGVLWDEGGGLLDASLLGVLARAEASTARPKALPAAKAIDAKEALADKSFSARWGDPRQGSSPASGARARRPNSRELLLAPPET